MNSFDNVSIEEVGGYSDYLAMQLMEIEHLEEFNRWIDTNRPTSDELDRWFDESCAGDDDHDDDHDDDYDDDGQPSEYEEWQDYMGGDDWDHGQYDCDY